MPEGDAFTQTVPAPAASHQLSPNGRASTLKDQAECGTAARCLPLRVGRPHVGSSEKLVAFSCKRRGFCPRCGARRMAETAAHLVDHVIPRVPMRQCVLSFPIPLRLLFAEHRDPHRALSP
jgi:hypothetical protein